MRHLYRKLYLTIIASLLLVVLIAGLLWRLGRATPPGSRAFEIAGELMAAELPPPSAAPATQQAAIDRLHDRLAHRPRALRWGSPPGGRRRPSRAPVRPPAPVAWLDLRP